MSKDNRKLSADEVQKFINGAIQQYGRFSFNAGISEYPQDDARRLKSLEEARRAECHSEPHTLATRALCKVWRATFGRWGDDWVFLALLGISMALISYVMDVFITLIFQVRVWLYHVSSLHLALQFFSWTSLPVVVMVLSAILVHHAAPQAAGSGLPELKAIFRGCEMKGFFDFRTLAMKIIGLTITLGCGMPLGREGSLIHMSTIVAALLSKFGNKLRDPLYAVADETWRHCDMLAVACAVGVATTFAAPIGGVLFSIEVTWVYFAVRNYWRGFFAAVCGAFTFRLLAVCFQKEETVVSIYLTNFSKSFPFDTTEILAYVFLGIWSGFAAALYIWMHRKWLVFLRTNLIFKKHIYMYVALVVLVTESLIFPAGAGQFIAGDVDTGYQMTALFKNFTWTQTNLSLSQTKMLSHWKVEQIGVFSSLGIYILYMWIFSILCSSIPVPFGMFGPVLTLGAAMGRLVGELLIVFAPESFRYSKFVETFIPGSYYAKVGAAAFSGAVTHTVSTAVIVFEMTAGNVQHPLPVMISVLIANGICNLLQPSIYDSLMLIKKLPYLPHLSHKPSSYLVYVRDFMVQNVKFVWHAMTYAELVDVLNENEAFNSFPLVNSKEDMILLGSIKREELKNLVEEHLSDKRRVSVAAKHCLDTIERRDSNNSKESETRRVSFEELMSVTTNPLPPPSRNTDEGVFNPILGDEEKPRFFTFRSLRKNKSFTLPILEEIPEISVPQRDGANENIGTMTLSAKEVLRRSSSVIISCSPYVIERENSFDAKDQLTADSIDAVNLATPLAVHMSTDERRHWETAELRKPAPLKFYSCVDSAPFQLVANTPLPRAHAQFCLLGLRRAYVTNVGRLVGVVTLVELRKATENANAGIRQKYAQNGNDTKVI